MPKKPSDKERLDLIVKYGVIRDTQIQIDGKWFYIGTRKEIDAAIRAEEKKK